MEPTVVVMPGYEDSGPDHWQSHWCRRHPEYVRVTGLAWLNPEREAWLAALRDAIRSIPGPVVVAAHSLGSVTVAALGAHAPPNLVAALLVAPCDTEQPGFPAVIRGFTPMPSTVLPFPTTLVASRDDPWITFDRAIEVAAAWGSLPVDIGPAGHVNTASGLGSWPVGAALLDDLVRKASRP